MKIMDFRDARRTARKHVGGRRRVNVIYLPGRAASFWARITPRGNYRVIGIIDVSRVQILA